MNEQDYKNLIVAYQNKSYDLFSQVVALEAKLSTSNQLVEALTAKVNELKSDLGGIPLLALECFATFFSHME